MAFWVKVDGQAILFGIFPVGSEKDMVAFCISVFATDETLTFYVSIYDAFMVFLSFFSFVGSLGIIILPGSSGVPP